MFTDARHRLGFVPPKTCGSRRLITPVSEERANRSAPTRDLRHVEPASLLG